MLYDVLIQELNFLRNGGRVKEEKYVCFLSGKFKGKEWIVVPSFSEHGEGTDVRDEEGEGIEMPWKIYFGKFEVRVVDGLVVREFGKLEKIK